jgi:hypothetical protein
VHVGPDLQRKLTTAAAVLIVAVCPVLTWVVLNGGRMPTLALIGILAMTVGIYIGLRQPLWLFWGLAVVIGLLPFGYFPGIHIPLYLPFAFGSLLAALIHPSARRGLHPMERAVVALVVAAGFSFLANLSSIVDLDEYTRWSAATLTTIALLRLSRENLERFGRIFVYAVTVNALVGIGSALTGGSTMFVRLFSPFGYGRVDLVRFVVSSEGQTNSVRLGGLWIDPNAAGLALVVGLAICLILLKGTTRGLVTCILLVAIVLTLSRAAIFSSLVGLLLVVLFHSMHTRTRLICILSPVLLGVIAMATPQVRTRILSSFGREDPGATARAEGLKKFGQDMGSHWLLGRPWGSPEFKSGEVAFKLNFAANAPLDAIYRGGLIVGAIFIVILIMGCVMSCRALRSASLQHAAYGGLFIGLTLVAFQVDHPIVLIHQIVLTFSILLVFLVYVDGDRRRPRIDPAVATAVHGVKSEPLTPQPS